MAYIYMIKNRINGKMYVGKTEHINPITRWQEHIRASKRNDCLHRPLYLAMNKYGIDNFEFSIIEETSIPEEREQYFIAQLDTYNNGYNATLGGDGSKLVNEELIILTYNEINNVTIVAEMLGHDAKTVKRTLVNNGIIPLTSVESNKLFKSKPVIQIDKKTNEVVNQFESASEAGRSTYKGKNVKACIDHIIDVCNNKRKTANGYIWRYAA